MIVPPSRSRTLRLAAIAAAGALAFGACGGSDGASPLALGAARAVQLDAAESDVEISDDDATCIGEKIVDDLGEERVTELGAEEIEGDLADAEVETFDYSELDEAEIRTIAEAHEGCLDDFDALTSGLVASGILDASDETFSASAEEAACIGDAVVDGVGAVDIFVRGVQIDEEGDLLAGSEDDGEVYADAVLGCVDFTAALASSFEENGVPAETAACIAGKFSEDEVRSLLVSAFGGSFDESQLLETVFEYAADCA